MRIDPKSLVLDALFGRWGRSAPIEAGLTVLVPCPADMPFLLRFALEGLAAIDLSDCIQVIVLGDGATDDSALRREVERSADPRIEMARVGPLAHRFTHEMGRPGMEVANWAHWSMIVEGIRKARGEAIFLHDSDAFFIDEDGLARQYHEFRDRGMASLGVTPRADRSFVDRGLTIPGTWELMFSNRWARGYRPIDHKGRRRSTPDGPFEFDTMLYPQFLDAGSGKVGVIDPPPRLVHFAGTITTYRHFRDRAGSPVVDVIFRILLLSLLEELVPPADGPRLLPDVDDLARGLEDASAPVSYTTDEAAREYPEFRRMVDELCESPVIRGERADRLRDRLRPFDDHFAARPAAPGGDRPAHRRSGLA